MVKTSQAEKVDDYVEPSHAAETPEEVDERIDRENSNSFPASDPPSWTLGSN